MSIFNALMVQDLSAVQGWVLSLVKRAEQLGDPSVLQRRCAFARELVVRAGQNGTDLEKTIDRLADRKIDLSAARAFLSSVTVPSVKLPFGALWQAANHPFASQLVQDPKLLTRGIVESIDQLMLKAPIRSLAITPVNTFHLSDRRPSSPPRALGESKSFETVSKCLEGDMKASGWAVLQFDRECLDLSRGDQMLSITLDFPGRAKTAKKRDILGAFQGSPLLTALQRSPGKGSPHLVNLHFDGELQYHHGRDQPNHYASTIEEYLFFRWDPGLANINLFGNVSLLSLVTGLGEVYRGKLRVAENMLRKHQPKSDKGVAVNVCFPKEVEWRRFFTNAAAVAFNVYVDAKTDLSPGELHHLFHRVGPRFLSVMTERFLDALPPWAVYNFGIPV